MTPAIILGTIFFIIIIFSASIGLYKLIKIIYKDKYFPNIFIVLLILLYSLLMLGFINYILYTFK